MIQEILKKSKQNKNSLWSKKKKKECKEYEAALSLFIKGIIKISRKVNVENELNLWYLIGSSVNSRKTA